uniref:WD domain, G-beta repeat, putative n=1 Tax=Theileria annulata TaxID=5874 RepID=A0A3B0NGK7_THEAN
MDKNCINTAMCFMPSAETKFDVRCGSINNHLNILATGTEQGVVVLWKINPEDSFNVNHNISLTRFKEKYERKHKLKLVPIFMLVSNNNSVAFPVIQVEFAIGSNYTSSLNLNKDSSRGFNSVEIGEDILLGLHEDSSLCIWSLSNYRCLHRIRGPPFPIRSIKVLPDRRFIATVGDSKVNVIDIWNIKLIETLDINNKLVLSKEKGARSIETNSSDEQKSDFSGNSETSDTSPKILTTSCNSFPRIKIKNGVLKDNNKEGRNEFNNVDQDGSRIIIFVAITNNNEMLVWDLTHSILSHKSSEPSFNGPVKVITEWDTIHQITVPIINHNNSHSTVNGGPANNKSGTIDNKMANNKATNSINNTNCKFTRGHVKKPTIREYIYELENDPGELCVIGNYVLLMVGYRILVWFYEAHELTRTAEILSFSDDDFSTKNKWLGLECIKFRSQTVLCSWLKNGKMKFFIVPKGNNRHFEPMKESINFPTSQFNSEKSYVIYHNHREESDNFEDLYLFSFDKNVYYSRNGLNDWEIEKINWTNHPNYTKVKFTCLAERSGNLTKFDLYQNGDLIVNHLKTFKTEIMTPPSLFLYIVNNINRTWKFTPFILTDAINEYLHRFNTRSSSFSSFNSKMNELENISGVRIMHSTCEYLVLGFETSVLVYSIRSLRVKFYINAVHFSKIRSIHNVYSLIGENASELVELPTNFATIDAEGYLVIFNIHEINKSSKKSDSSDHNKIEIDDESIYKSDSVQVENDFGLSDPGSNCLTDLQLSNFFIYLKNLKGIYRINSKYQLSNICIDRLVLDKNRDLLLILTSTNVLIWRLSTGDFISKFPYLSLYRQAIFSTSTDTSASNNTKDINNITISDALSVFLNFNSDTGESQELKIPNYYSSLSLFSEKYKKRISSNLFLSNLVLQFSQSNIDNGTNGLKDDSSEMVGVPEDINASKICINTIKRSETCPTECNHSECDVTNCSIPFIIFPLEYLLDAENNRIDFLTLSKDSVFCYLGIPNGSLTIPLGVSFNERVYNLIKKRTTESMVDCSPSNRINSSLNSTLDGVNSRYMLTCNMFYKQFLSQICDNISAKEFKNANTRKYSIDDVSMSLTSYPFKDFGANNVDVWLIINIMMSTERVNSLDKVFWFLKSYLKVIEKEEIDLHVSRALANIHVSQSFKLNGKANLPQIHICDCNFTVFTFGTSCGSCHKTKSDTEFTQPIKNLKNIYEDQSIILLSLISVEIFIYSLKSSIRLGIKCYSLSSYVFKLLLTKLLSLEENSEFTKTSKGNKKVNGSVLKSTKNFDVKAFLLNVFEQGFGVVWNLSNFSKHSILPDQIRHTKYSTLFRQSTHITNISSIDTAYFILYAFHHYHVLRDKSWTKILLVSCSQDTTLALYIIGWIVKKRKLSNKAIMSALNLIVDFMENYIELSFTYLADIVSIVIKCLDPLDYNIRVLLLKPATNALFYMVKNVPMVDFHQDTQRFAVGSQSGHVIIYDIRTATKWRMFIGSQSQIACIAFGSNGNLIAAYYNQIPAFMVWKCSSSGLIGSLLSNTNKELKSIKLKPINILPDLNQVIKTRILFSVKYLIYTYF